MVLAMLAWPIVESLPALLSQRYSPFEIVWIRYGTHLLLMLTLWGPVNASRLVRTRQPVPHAIRAATMLGMPLAFVLGSQRMSTDAIMAVFWIAPFIALFLARVGLGERVQTRHWLVALAGFTGAWLMLGQPGGVLRLSSIFPIAMAGCFALYQVLTRAMRTETTASRLFYTALGVWLPLSAALPWFWITPTLRDLAIMMAIGVLGFLFLAGLDHALDTVPVSSVVPFTLAQPVWGVLLHALVYGRVPGLGAMAGLVMVLGAWLALGRLTGQYRRSIG